jgi:hypothetical protein
MTGFWKILSKKQRDRINESITTVKNKIVISPLLLKSNNMKILFFFLFLTTSSIKSLFAQQNDTIPPILVGIPNDLTLECDEKIPSASDYKVSATDNEDISVSLSFVQVKLNGNCQNQFYLLNSWRATDKSNNSTEKTQRITVKDNKVPIIKGVLDDITIFDLAQFPSIPKITVEDNCNGFVEVYFKEVGINISNGVIYTQTWTAIDPCGNKSEKERKITFIKKVANNDIDNQSIIILPNPSKGLFTIQNAPSEEYDVSVYNTEGKGILQQFNISEIDLSNEQNGVYQVFVKSSYAIKVFLIVKVN